MQTPALSKALQQPMQTMALPRALPASLPSGPAGAIFTCVKLLPVHRVACTMPKPKYNPVIIGYGIAEAVVLCPVSLL